MLRRDIFITLIVALVLIVGTTAAWSADFALGNAPTSFRGLAWGITLDQAPELLPVKERGYKNTYFRTNESLTFANAEIQSVAYYFRKGKFYRVGIAFKGRANHFLLKERLLSSYGPGRGLGYRYGWMWPEFSVEISFDDETKSGALYYTYEGKLD